jgi:transcriptional regulator with GAF, ATPase, and Fis domain
VLAVGDELTAEDFCMRLELDEEMPVRDQVKSAERESLRLLLIEQGGNIARSAKVLGIARTTLLSRAKKYGLVP